MAIGQAAERYLGEGEGTVTKMIESQTARMPSGAYLSLAIGSMLISLMLMMGGRRALANFVGQWAPTLLIIGLYNKLVKLEGSE
jgi:hypothetical protein